MVLLTDGQKAVRTVLAWCSTAISVAGVADTERTWQMFNESHPISTAEVATKANCEPNKFYDLDANFKPLGQVEQSHFFSEPVFLYLASQGGASCLVVSEIKLPEYTVVVKGQLGNIEDSLRNGPTELEVGTVYFKATHANEGNDWISVQK